LNAAAIGQVLDCLRAADAEQCRREYDMRRLLSQFLADQSGATAIEYALIAAGISIVIVTVVNGIGTQVNAKFAAVSASLK
jgi:pilus assembly protein Flp/PilA